MRWDLYLLGNPDHYTNLTLDSEENYIGSESKDDYVYRLITFSDTSLYDFLQMTSRKKRTKKQMKEFLNSLAGREEFGAAPVNSAEPDDDDFIEKDIDDDQEQKIGDKSDAVTMHPFAPGHPLYRTHYLRCDPCDLEKCVPNFVGGSLPRMDEGDREYYCCTMLTLFKPWRSGKQLKNEIDNWDETFREHKFTAKALRLMANFNVRYECNDARDDFSAIDRRKRCALPLFSKGQSIDDSEDENSDFGEYGEDEAGMD
ncbi:hypothetical protein B0H13DRAFT_1650428 [Mycena leptocephala]|nr:hypothetical protein B0H13DRAFT_1650428 [Mycena leptocephala]